MRRSPALAALGLLAATALAGCRSDDPPPPAETHRIVAGDSYVALGDSYTAGPGLTAPDAPDGCYRSTTNYPNLLADAKGLELRDVSCGGANTLSLTQRQTTVDGGTVAPQLNALGPDTDLVTIRIGGNDFALFTLITQICPSLAAGDPDGHPCVTEDQKSTLPVSELLARLEDRVTAALEDVVDKAPNATVLAVGYPAIIPERGTCSNLPLAVGDYGLAHRINVGYNDALVAAAEATGATYVDVYPATVGHDICGHPPWIAGARSKNTVAAWHPYEQEQQTTADLIEEALREG